MEKTHTHTHKHTDTHTKYTHTQKRTQTHVYSILPVVALLVVAVVSVYNTTFRILLRLLAQTRCEPLRDQEQVLKEG